MIAGANGAGKSTNASAILPPSIPFLNADVIARGLPDTSFSNKDIQSARLLFEEWDELARQRADFAVETTLASRSLAGRVARLSASGYQFHLIIFWLASADLAIERVAERVRRGGHDIPSETIRRRYAHGLHNFFAFYQPLADSWSIFDNTTVGISRLVAIGQHRDIVQVYEPTVWQRIRKAGANGEE